MESLCCRFFGAPTLRESYTNARVQIAGAISHMTIVSPLNKDDQSHKTPHA